MPSYKLTVAYDGTDYCGFQVQPNGVTIQGELMKAAIELFGASVTVTGASRTDSGVHARGQVVLLKGDKNIEVRKMPLAMNVRLPEDIAVVAAEIVDEDWHPRYQDHSKTYSYKIYNGQFHYPQEKSDSFHFRYDLDLDLMRQGAELMLGTHDFESYSSARKKNPDDTIRTIYDIQLLEHKRMIEIIIKGNGFLYNMVRIMVGTLIELGQHRRSLASISESLGTRNRGLTGKTAPAKGLTLMQIDYETKV